jgi:DNA-binding MarR family transcriptional regulator
MTTSQPGDPADDDRAMAVQATRALARVSRMLERSSPELNLAHYRVLSAIASGDARASRVAERLALGKPTVSAAVDALCRRGMLARGDVDGDQRAAALSLTDEGEAVLGRVEAEMAARITDLSQRTPDAARLLESLSWLGAAIDEVVAERHAGRRETR